MLSLITVPVTEPVETAAVKDWLRVVDARDDTLIEALIAAARQSAEDFQNRAYLQQTWQLTLDAFPACILLERVPVQSVMSIEYIDETGVTQTVDTNAYQVDVHSEPGRITPAYLETWPTPRAVMNAVTVTFQAGYPDVAMIPGAITTAIKVWVTDLFDHRGSFSIGAPVHLMPHAVKMLLWPDRLLKAL